MSNQFNNEFQQSSELETNYNPATKSDDSYPSVNAGQIEAARKANNLWNFNGKELEKFVANGSTTVETSLIDRKTGEETEMKLLHFFGWSDDRAFAERENAFVTTMRRVGRNNDQQINTAHAETVNSAFYEKVIVGGCLLIPKGNGETDRIEKTGEEMLEFARLYPEAAAEAVETWLEGVSFKILDDSSGFDWMFSSQPVVKVQWFLGDEDDPLAAGILTFKSPTKENRKRLDEESQNIKTRKQGDANIALMSENYGKKLQYGLTHLVNVEGIAIGAPGVDFAEKLKQEFVIKFNPIWFIEAVELMHDSFAFLKGKPAKS